MKFTAKFIDTALRNYYETQALYMVSNIYAFHSRYKETDFLVVKSNNRYCYDVEIKVSVSDFKADFNKTDKHDIIEKGSYKSKHTTFKTVKGKRKMYSAGRAIPVSDRPNRFYYAVPEGLISVDDVPEYAGLLYVSESGAVTKVKESKIIHKTKLNIEKMLCRKFYFYWMNTLEAVEIVKKALKSCEKRRK